jgi:Ulp1 family protease
MPRRLMACLRGLNWLNDEVMNMYMGLLLVKLCLPSF